MAPNVKISITRCRLRREGCPSWMEHNWAFEPCFQHFLGPSRNLQLLGFGLRSLSRPPSAPSTRGLLETILRQTCSWLQLQLTYHWLSYQGKWSFLKLLRQFQWSLHSSSHSKTFSLFLSVVVSFQAVQSNDFFQPDGLSLQITILCVEICPDRGLRWAESGVIFWDYF